MSRKVEGILFEADSTSGLLLIIGEKLNIKYKNRTYEGHTVKFTQESIEMLDKKGNQAFLETHITNVYPFEVKEPEMKAQKRKSLTYQISLIRPGSEWIVSEEKNPVLLAKTLTLEPDSLIARSEESAVSMKIGTLETKAGT